MIFTKAHGLGNDFIITDDRENNFSGDLSALAKKLCHRRTGIGADGLIFVRKSDCCDVRMQIFNSDGSEAEMCGNASRCVALHLFRRKLVNKKQISLDTLAGIIRTDITDEARGLVRVDMGVPRLTKGEIPMTGNPAETAVNFPLTAAGQTFYATAVSMGNPHLVIFVPDISQVPLAAWGPQLETHPLFPRKTNVEFVQVLDSKTVRMRVWERGAGITQACGTGSCATAAACILNHKTEKNITVKLDGGDLFIEWPDKKNIFMTGLAQAVFTGDYLGD